MADIVVRLIQKREKHMRELLIRKLAEGWREAETHYIRTKFSDDSLKSEMFDKQERAKLTKEEREKLESICNSWAV